MQGQWFYGVATNRLGPVAVPELQRLAQMGQINPMTMVWSEGMPQWIPAGTLPFLYPPGAMQAMAAMQNDGGALNLLVPVGPQSGMSIAAGYCGLFGLLFWIIAPLGIVFGILGLRDIKAHPEKRGKGRAITGIVCGAIVIALFAALMGVGMFGSHHRY